MTLKNPPKSAIAKIMNKKSIFQMVLSPLGVNDLRIDCTILLRKYVITSIEELKTLLIPMQAKRVGS